MMKLLIYSKGNKNYHILQHVDYENQALTPKLWSDADVGLS